MTWLAAIIPPLTVLLLAMLAVLPWGLSEGMHHYLPLLPLIAIHYWTVRRPFAMPALFVFVVGLAMDVLTNGPLGLWSLIYLTGLAFAYWARDLTLQLSRLTTWAAFCGCMALVSLTQWIVASLYFGRLIDWRPLAEAVAYACATYPVLAMLFWPVSKPWSRPRLGTLARGG